MSHFCGLVILTPEYAEFNGMDDSLSKYDENLEYPEYCRGEVPESDKVDFLIHFLINKSDDKELRDGFEKFKIGFIKYMRGKKGYLTQKQYQEKYPYARDKETKMGWATGLIYTNNERFADYFKKGYPELYAKFEDTYKMYGDDWNGRRWSKNTRGIWCEYSTYNPNSKWDWYCEGGRWHNSIKTKSGEFVDACKLDEIDFEPYPEDAYEDDKDWAGNPCKKLKDGFEWHYDNENTPFCIVIDGVWYEKGDMGWWGCVSNEKGDGEWKDEFFKLLESLPADSDVYNVDFHI